ncbi:restriction endonuclease subunit S [Acinetobacter bereziniae]|uniref:restriction endonuclease subunit S n=1 Tax=Acinetobacter bereziniae TaxID=106648 RepID=UPI002576691D|nr:restriction endonuclease subunit S [Acinetobacter bereziniae]MDM1786374.1 restriction endonuclease subunit S [Acinetobacter bereziniae]
MTPEDKARISGMINLPANWSFTKIKVIADLTTGDLDANAAQSDGIYPFFTCSDEISKINNYAFNQEAILLAGNGSFGVKWFEGKFNAYQRTYVITPTHIHGQYLYYYLYSKNSYFHSVSRGSTIKYLRIADIHDLDVPYPPLKEQKKIVDKIDELLSDLDNGVEELETAQKKIELYRQSLLKSAVEGGFSKEWRKSQTEVYETGEQLLVRILKERRERWEQEKLKEFREKGKNPSKNWQEKYPEPVKPDTENLPQLPESWAWASLDQVMLIKGGIQKKPSRAPVNNKFPFLRVANVYRSQLNLDDIHEIELFEGEIERYKLEKGDLLIVEGNGSLTEIGRCAIWDGSIPNAVHQNHLIRARPIHVLSQYLETWLNSSDGINYMAKLAVTTSGLYSLSVGKIAKIPVPLPPLNEQSFITIDLASKLEQ